MEELQIVKYLELMDTLCILGGVSAVAGSFSGLLWRLGNIDVGGRKNHPPDTSRRSEPATIIVEIVKSGLGDLIISPRSWRESKDGLRQVILGSVEAVRVCHTAGNYLTANSVMCEI